MQSWIEKFLVSWVMKQLTPEVVMKVEDAIKIFLVTELTALAAKTPTDIDDKVMARLAELLGVVVPAPVAVVVVASV